MLVEESECLSYYWFIFRDVLAAVFMRQHHHRAELQCCVPLVFQPCVAFHSRVVAGFVLAVFCGVGQSAVLYLLGERCSVVSPIETGAPCGVWQHPQICVKLCRHHVRVAALEHGPVYETLVLCRHGAAAPFAEVGSEGAFRIGEDGVEGE